MATKTVSWFRKRFAAHEHNVPSEVAYAFGCVLGKVSSLLPNTSKVRGELANAGCEIHVRLMIRELSS